MAERKLHSWKWTLSDIDKVEKNGRTVFSLFACGGGSSMGYKLAGYDVLGNVEIDPTTAETYRRNLNPRFSYVEDVRDFVKREDLPAELYHLDVLDGSPPCTTFSTAGDREKTWGKMKKFAEGQKLQRLDDLFFVYIEAVRKLQPKVFIAENVSGLVKGNARGYVREIFQGFRDAGYTCQLFLLNAATMGVPQSRERTFFIGHRKDLDFPKLVLEFNEAPIPFGKVRSEHGVPFQEGSIFAELMEKRLPTDKNTCEISMRERGVYSGFTNKIISDDDVCGTLVSGSTIIRYSDGLKFSDSDFKNVGTFPQDYDCGSRTAQFLTGMSVPPLMMERVAGAVYDQWFSKEVKA